MRRNIKKLGQFLLIPALLIMVGCSNTGGDKTPNPPTPEGNNNLSEIQLTPQNVHINEGFTLTCNVTEKIKVENPKYTWKVYDMEVLLTTLEAQVVEGKIMLSSEKGLMGNIKATLTLSGTYNKNNYEESRTINFITANNDIRNCNWGESKQLCKENLSHYKITDLDESKADELSFNEENIMEKKHFNGSSFDKGLYTARGDRHTTYSFKNNGLIGVSYQLTNWIKSDSSAVKSAQSFFTTYADCEHMTREGAKYDYTIAKGVQLTEVEKAQAENFKSGKADKIAVDLYNAVKENKVTLTGTHSCAATKLDMKVVNDATKNQVVINVAYLPNK